MAVQGAPFLLDDYIHIYATHTTGGFASSPRLSSRPGAWLTQAVSFGIADDHPLIMLLLVTAANVAAAVALYNAVSRFFPAPTPLLVAGLWVLLANHSTLTFWGAALPAVLALAFTFGGVTLLSRGRWIWACALFAASLLTYELGIALVLVASVVVGTRVLTPLDGMPAARPVRLWHRAVMVGVLVAVTGWMARNPTHDVEPGLPDVMTVWSGHVAYGVVSTQPSSALLLRALEYGTLAAVAVCGVLWLAGDRDRGRGPSVVLAGAAVMALGMALLLVSPPTGLYGLSNRFYGLSSVGTALVFVGIGLTVWQRSRGLAVAGAATLAALCVVGQVVATRSAVQASDDMVALIRHIGTEYDDPAETRFMVEPPLDRNGFNGGDHWFARYAFDLAYPEGVGRMRMAEDHDEFSRPEPNEVVITWEEVLG